MFLMVLTCLGSAHAVFILHRPAVCSQQWLVLDSQVPFRRVHLQEGDGHVDLYDTSGQQVMQRCILLLHCKATAWTSLVQLNMTFAALHARIVARQSSVSCESSVYVANTGLPLPAMFTCAKCLSMQIQSLICTALYLFFSYTILLSHQMSMKRMIDLSVGHTASSC